MKEDFGNGFVKGTRLGVVDRVIVVGATFSQVVREGLDGGVVEVACLGPVGSVVVAGFLVVVGRCFGSGFIEASSL